MLFPGNSSFPRIFSDSQGSPSAQSRRTKPCLYPSHLTSFNHRSGGSPLLHDLAHGQCGLYRADTKTPRPTKTRASRAVSAWPGQFIKGHPSFRRATQGGRQHPRNCGNLLRFFHSSAPTPPTRLRLRARRSSRDFSRMFRSERLLAPPTRIFTSTSGM